MKKINIFNRNTNSPSYRGTGPRKNVPSFRGNAESPQGCRESSYRGNAVSRGFNCGGGIPLFSGMTKKICHKFPSREGQSRAVAFCRGGWRVAPAGVVREYRIITNALTTSRCSTPYSSTGGELTHIILYKLF